MGECLLSSRNLNSNTGLSNLVQVNIICPKPTTIQNYTRGIIEIQDRLGYTTPKRYYIDGDSTALTIFINISTYKSWTFKRYNGDGYIAGGAACTINIENMEEGKIYTVDFVAAESDHNEGYIFGIEIDMNADNPDLACNYLYNAKDFTPLKFELSNGQPTVNYGSWSNSLISEILGIRPCYLSREDHSVTYLDFDNTSLDDADKKETSAHIGQVSVYDSTSSTLSRLMDVDVMIEFKPRWYKFSVDGNILTFKVATYKVADDWVQDAFLTTDGRLEDNIKNMYYGMYEGAVDVIPPTTTHGTKYYILRSIKPTTSNLPGADIPSNSVYTLQELPAGYGFADWSRHCYITGLLMLVTKCRNIQNATHTGNSDFTNMAPIGELMGAGMFAYSKISNSIKVFGIENFWGNYPEFCDKIYSNVSDDMVELYLKKHNNVKVEIDGTAGCPIFNNESVNFETKDVSNKIPMNEKLYISRISVNENGSCIIPELVQADPSISFGDAVYIDSSYTNGFMIIGMHDGFSNLDIGPLSMYFGKDLGVNTGVSCDNKVAYRLIYCN